MWVDSKKEAVGLTSNPLGGPKGSENQTSSSSIKPQLAADFSLLNFIKIHYDLTKNTSANLTFVLNIFAS